ncbi:MULTISPECIES: S1/P1 nuclease [unclassified Mesorhizobium]|uniref:S1/P1 nuclease n=1 Tax=unclassified Mesorhizobium TaxID=325217 RepID=UPI0015E2B318|nr:MULTISPECIES: S1/P1 nuclease [unclassified Mesorhizobium]
MARTRAGVVLLGAMMVGCAIGPAAAWGPEGHSIVAEIAQRRLSATALTEVKRILGGEVSMASVASWADDVRYSVHPESYNWHFVDIPLANDTYDPVSECAANAQGDCAIAEIDRAEHEITCASDPMQRRDSLRYLIHVVGDIHQPFHTVADNIGENTLTVTVKFGGLIKSPPKFPGDNLHAVWDSTIIKQTTYAWGSYVDRLEGDWLLKHPEASQTLDPVAWTLEAHALAKDMSAGVATGTVLDDAYYNKALPIVDQQLGRAGLRLAAVLNRWLSTAPACPLP